MKAIICAASVSALASIAAFGIFIWYVAVCALIGVNP